MPPTEGPQASVLTLLQGPRHIGNRNAQANDLMVGRVPVFYQTEHLHVEHREVHPQVFVHLALRHLGIAIQMTKRLVDDIKHLATVLFLAEHLTALGVDGMQVIALHHHLGYLAELLGHALLGNDELVFHIVVVLDEATQPFDVLGIVRIIVDSGHCTQLVEALDQHALRIHIGKAQGTYYLGHALGTPPLLDSFEQGPAHLNIVDEVNPAETYTIALPTVVGTMIDDACYATHHPVVLIGQEIFGLAELKGGILVFAQCMLLVSIQVGGVVLIATIQVVMELNEGIEVLFAGNFPYLYCTHLSFRTLNSEQR